MPLKKDYLIRMIKKLEEDRWLASCALCSWNTTEDDEKTARINLTRHINTAHKNKGTKVIEGETIPPSEKPPDIPEPISPQGRRKENKI